MSNESPHSPEEQQIRIEIEQVRAELPPEVAANAREGGRIAAEKGRNDPRTCNLKDLKVSKSKKPAMKLAERRAKAGELYLNGYDQRRVAEELGVSISTISRDLAKLHKQWITDSSEAVDAIKARELQRIDRIEREAWGGWESSRAERFLGRVAWCVETRLKLIGAFVNKVSLTDPTGEEPSIRFDFNKLNVDELRVLVQLSKQSDQGKSTVTTVDGAVLEHAEEGKDAAA